MIVKIERYEEGQKFWLVDGFEKVSVSDFLKTKTEHEKNIDDVTILDYWYSQANACSCSIPNEECCDCCSSIRLICRNKDGAESSILFDTIAYILNDNGKTVEKVVVNYPQIR